MFPESLSLPLAGWVDRAVDWLVVEHGDFFEAASNGLLAVLVRLEGLLRGLPWWTVVLLVAAFGWHASRRWTLALGLRSSCPSWTRRKPCRASST